MFPKLTLYKHYLAEQHRKSPFPDVTGKTTLERMNYAANLCDEWDNFIDIGAGNGHYATALSHLFKRGTMIEVDHLKEHDSIRNVNKNITIFNDIFERYEVGTDKFNFVLLADIFEHITNIDTFTDKLSKMQPVDGVVYIMTPNPIFCGPAAESAIYFKKYTYGHIKHYTKNELVTIMNKKGYELIFHLYEETNFRQKAKITQTIEDIYQRGSAWKKHLLFNPLALPLLKFSYKILEIITYAVEKKYSQDPFSTMTQDFAFKKVS